MKSVIKNSLCAAFVLIAIGASAQSNPNPENNGWVVSKDVQRYSNKSLLEPTGILVKSVGTPAHVNSKMVRKRSSESDKSPSNIKSSGTPAWVISKPVQLKKN